MSCQVTYLTIGRKLKEDPSWPWDGPANSMSTRRSTWRSRCSGAKATKARRWRTSRKPWGSPSSSLYSAFGNKEELFRKALDRYVDGPGGYFQVALAKPTMRAVVEHLLYESADAVTDPNHPPGCLAVQGALSCGDAAESIKQELMSRRAKGEQDLRQRFERRDRRRRPACRDPMPPISRPTSPRSCRAWRCRRPAARRASNCARSPRWRCVPGRRRVWRRSDVHASRLLRQSHRPQRERIGDRDFIQPVESPRRAAVAGAHVGAQQHRAAAAHGRAQPRDPFRRLPIGDARIGQPAHRQDRRIVLRRDDCRRASRTRWCENPFRSRSGCPIPAIPAASAAACRRAWCSSTSTNGTSATMPANNSPARLATAPISMPPALPPWPTMRFALVYFASISARAERCEIVERVRLLLALAVEIPAPALVGAAADMRDGVDKAAIDQRQPVGGETRPASPCRRSRSRRAAAARCRRAPDPCDAGSRPAPARRHATSP